jgi:glycosyltransferase involved in cell wall biosynthesis
MKVLILVDQVIRPGGLERALAHKVGAWCKAGHDLEIVTIETAGKAPFYDFPEVVVWRDLGIHYDHRRSLLAPANLLRAIRHFFRLRSAMRRSQPDVVIHCGYGYDFYFGPLVVASNTFLIKENHSSRYPLSKSANSLVGRLKRRVRLFVEERYDACVYLSAEEAKLAGARNAVVIPNPVADAPSTRRNRRNVVIAAGRICHVKGFDRLLQAWAIASPQLQGWLLEIYGDGELSDVMALENQIADLGLAGRVSILGATPQILDRMAESSVFAMTSRTECFPMVLLESMQLGLPVIAFDCPTGPRNILADGATGLLVPDGDVDAFAASLIYLVKHEEFRQQLSDNAKQHVQRYSVPEVARQWGKLFARVEMQ